MLPEAEYQNFLDWFNMHWGGTPPPNDASLSNDPRYQEYYQTFIYLPQYEQTFPGVSPSTSISPAQQQELDTFNRRSGTNYTWEDYQFLYPPAPPFPTTPPPEGFHYELQDNRWIPVYGVRTTEPPKAPEGYSSYEEALASAPAGSGYYPVMGTNGRWFLQAPSPTSDIEKQRLGLEQQQFAWQQQYQQQGLEAEKQARLANLRANPQSWLEYASLAGQQPAIQPWMLPLMPQEYAGTVAGAPIPGWQAGAPTMAELPSLTNPSIQYQARMGPTALQQYYGYQQARTGAAPEESQFRLWSQAPPGGSSKGLVWQR